MTTVDMGTCPDQDFMSPGVEATTPGTAPKHPRFYGVFLMSPCHSLCLGQKWHVSPSGPQGSSNFPVWQVPPHRLPMGHHKSFSSPLSSFVPIFVPYLPPLLNIIHWSSFFLLITLIFLSAKATSLYLVCPMKILPGFLIPSILRSISPNIQPCCWSNRPEDGRGVLSSWA